MIYTAQNSARRASVFDVEAMRKIKDVLSIDTETGNVVCVQQPFHVTDGEVDTATEKYRSIYPISGGDPLPCLFHCYGKM